jgi:hypothetical protein
VDVYSHTTTNQFTGMLTKKKRWKKCWVGSALDGRRRGGDTASQPLCHWRETCADDDALDMYGLTALSAKVRLPPQHVDGQQVSRRQNTANKRRSYRYLRTRGPESDNCARIAV